MPVLVLEPTKTYQLLLGSLFNDRGFKIVCLDSGALGLQKIMEERFDLICVALHLKDMSGIDFCRALRDKNKDNLPVIMVTSDVRKAVFAEGMAAGITEVFRKEDLLAITKYLTLFKEQQAGHLKVKGTVLYVENNDASLMLVQRLLASMGLRVIHVRSAEEAYKEFNASEYDLVLTDTLLNGPMSGLALIREIRGGPEKKKRVPILVVSSLEDTSRKIETLRNGANDYVLKPVIPEELAARIRNLIENKKLVDQVERQQQHLKEMAMTDSLTSLYNRHCLTEIAPRYISEATRHDIPLSFVVIDLDHFKKINDTYGHSLGDRVLVEVAGLLKKSCRKEDLAARFGGEEFLLILPHCKGKDAASKAERLREKIETLKPNGILVTASFGVYQLPLGSLVSFEEVFVMADRAVYEAKEKGRNLVILGEEEDEGLS